MSSSMALQAGCRVGDRPASCLQSSETWPGWLNWRADSKIVKRKLRLCQSGIICFNMFFRCFVYVENYCFYMFVFIFMAQACCMWMLFLPPSTFAQLRGHSMPFGSWYFSTLKELCSFERSLWLPACMVSSKETSGIPENTDRIRWTKPAENWKSSLKVTKVQKKIMKQRSKISKLTRLQKVLGHLVHSWCVGSSPGRKKRTNDRLCGKSIHNPYRNHTP